MNASTQRRQKIRHVRLTDLKPYWRNPRNNRETVALLVQSIKQYGYNQLLTVDHDLVIITGHARLLALRELGVQDLDVMELDLTPQEAKEYRLIDNKVAEYSHWTGDLEAELREIQNLAGMQEFFKEDLDALLKQAAGADVKPFTADDMAKAQDEQPDFADLAREHRESAREVVCPECGSSFFVK